MIKSRRPGILLLALTMLRYTSLILQIQKSCCIFWFGLKPLEFISFLIYSGQHTNMLGLSSQKRTTFLKCTQNTSLNVHWKQTNSLNIHWKQEYYSPGVHRCKRPRDGASLWVWSVRQPSELRTLPFFAFIIITFNFIIFTLKFSPLHFWGDCKRDVLPPDGPEAQVDAAENV